MTNVYYSKGLQKLKIEKMRNSRLMFMIMFKMMMVVVTMMMVMMISLPWF